MWNAFVGGINANQRRSDPGNHLVFNEKRRTFTSFIGRCLELASSLPPSLPPLLCPDMWDASCHVDASNSTLFRLELGAPFFIGHNPIPTPLAPFFMGFILSMMVMVILLFGGGALQFIAQRCFWLRPYTKTCTFLAIYINVAGLQYTCLP